MLSEEGSNNSGDSAVSEVFGSTLLELFDHCRSESLSEESLREFIDLHGLTPNSHNVDDYDFFMEACDNDQVTEGIIRCLLEYFPDAASDFGSDTVADGWSLLHCACNNRNVTGNIIQLLIEAAPETVRSVNNIGSMPLHILCVNKEVVEEAPVQAIQILKLLIEKYPEAVRHVTNGGCLPIHFASMWRSPEFCRVLIDAYPGSERITDDDGELPLHYACSKWAFPTVKYLYKLFPEAIHHTTSHGYYPIHTAIIGKSNNHGDNAIAAVEIVKFLLNCDPIVKLQRCVIIPLLLFACDRGENLDDSDIQMVHAAVEIVKAIYDARPEGIHDNALVSEIQSYHLQIQAFIHGELRYACQAKDHRLMTIQDDKGRLPLHTAIHDNASLGSIKLLVKGNPAAVQSADNSGALPLHVACQHHDSTNVIDYLVGLDPSTLDAVDRNGNTALHHACRSARYDAIALLLERYGAVSVSKRNARDRFPIELLFESDAVFDRECIEYTESVYRLLRANPEMIMGIDVQTMQSSAATSSTLPCPSGKKRKFGQ